MHALVLSRDTSELCIQVVPPWGLSCPVALAHSLGHCSVDIHCANSVSVLLTKGAFTLEGIMIMKANFLTLSNGDMAQSANP